MPTPSAVLALLVLLASAAPAAAQAADDAARAAAIELPQPSQADLDGWRAFVLPVGDEEAFDSLEWSADLVSGLERSAAEQKPLMLWLMNGHPLGCT